jgi:hypothetical protein
VTSINNKKVSGAWVFFNAVGTALDCDADCAHGCSYCVRNGAWYSCTRSALFAPL